jgi:large subunit ribosomal protein L13
MIKPTKDADIKRDWHLFDAEDKILGRLAVSIADVLMGKKKSYFVRHLDCGDYAVVINVEKVLVTGKKETQKKYTGFSGYPAGLKVKTLSQLRQELPTRIIYEAVRGMLPDNKLRERMLTRLHLFKGQDYPYKEKFEKKNEK